MHLFALCLIFPILTVNGQNDLYHIILESTEAFLYGRNCDSCQFLFYHHVSPGSANVTKHDNATHATLKFSLNSTLVTELKSNGITHQVCLMKRMVPKAGHSVDQPLENNLFCQQQPPITFADACANRNKPPAGKNVTLFCPDNIKSVCSHLSFQYRIYVETESGGPCPPSEIYKYSTKYHMMLETTEEYLYNPNCDGCYIFLQYTVVPSGVYFIKHGYSFPRRLDKDKFTLTSTDISNWKSNGNVMSFTICMKIKLNPTPSNGLRVAQDLTLAPTCHEEQNVTFVEACANRFRAMKLITLHYPYEGHVTVTLWEKYKFYVETADGQPCYVTDEPLSPPWEATTLDVSGACENCSIRPGIKFGNSTIFVTDTVIDENVLYNIMVETRDLLVYRRSCDGCEFLFVHIVSPYGSNVTKVNSGSPRYQGALKFSLNSTLVTELLSEGITHQMCLVKKVVPTASNGVDEVAQNILFCHQTPPVTFAQACVNRDQSQAEKNVTIFCPDNIKSICSHISLKYRIYLETESGGPCPAMEIRRYSIHYMIFEITDENIEWNNCDDCFYNSIFHKFGPGREDALEKTGPFPPRWNRLNFTLDSRKHDIFYQTCLNVSASSFTTTTNNRTRESNDAVVVCVYPVNREYERACSDRNQPDDKYSLKLSYPSEKHENRLTVSFNYRLYMEKEFGQACPVGEELYRLHWEVTDIDVRGACKNCDIRSAIRFRDMLLHTEFINAVDLSDAQMWDIIIDGFKTYTEVWYLDTRQTELATNVTYVAESPEHAAWILNSVSICEGVTENRVVPCTPYAKWRKYCTEISYTIKLLLTRSSGSSCLNDRLYLFNTYNG